MSKNPGTPDVDDTSVDDEYTDTSMFNTEEIVRNVEEGAKQHKKKKKDSKGDALRRLELRREQKLLEDDLMGLEGFEVEEWDGE